MGIAERDMRRNKAPGCYLPVYDWAEMNDPFTGNLDTLTYLFLQDNVRLLNIFQNVYFEFKELNAQGEEQTTYLNCGLSLQDIIADYKALYGERLFSQLYYFDKTNPQSQIGNQNSLRKLAAKLRAILDQNYFKYKRLAETLGFTYDPISNYDMIEEGTDTKTIAGEESLEHEVDASKINSREVYGPLNSITVGTNLDMQFDLSKKVSTDQKGVSDVRAGRAVSTDAQGAVGGSVATQDTSPNGIPTTNHYTTTMDDDATGRLQNYDTTLGDTSQSSVSKIEADMPATGRITAGSPASPSYTDTKSFTDRSDTNAHRLTRSGNIGVTTSQQMIESERQLVRFSLLKEFFEDLNKEFLLYVWD